MRKTIAVIGACACIALTAAALSPEKVMTKENGTYVVNTTTLAKDVNGYMGATPLLVYIKNDKVVKVEALPNNETPKYFARLKNKFLHSWDGLKVSAASKLEPDARTGATFSAKAVDKNVKAALEYYKKHKK